MVTVAELGLPRVPEPGKMVTVNDSGPMSRSPQMVRANAALLFGLTETVPDAGA